MQSAHNPQQSAMPSTQSQPWPQQPHLPEHVVLYILSLLPPSQKALTARLVCKAAHADFKQYTCISASCPDLPTAALKQLLQHAVTICDQYQLIAARARCGDLPGVQLLFNLGCAVDSSLCSKAAAAGQLSVLQWARMQTPPLPWNSFVCCAAASEGQLAVLKWARQQNPPCPWNSDVCYFAAKSGSLEILQWVRNPGDGRQPCPWNSSVCWWAASGGRLDILKWVRAQDPPCPWDSRVCWWAASEGQLAVLQWLRQQQPPCPWNKSMCREAAVHFRHQHVVRWLDSIVDWE